MIKFLFLFLFVVFVPAIVFSQNTKEYAAIINKAAKEIGDKDYPSAKKTLSKIDTNLFKPLQLEKGFYYQQLARLAYSDTYEDTKAVDYYNRAIKIYEFNKSYDDIGIAYSNLVGVLTDLKEYKKAEIAINKSFPYVKNDKVRYGNAYLNYSRLKLDIGDYSKAAAYSLQALNLYEQAGDQARISAGYFQMGITMETSKQFDKAIEYYQNGLAIRKILKDSLGMSNIYNNLGIIYKNQKQYELAKQNYRAANDIAVSMKRPVLSIGPLTNLAVIANRENDQKQAIKIYEEALQIAVKYNRSTNVKIIENNLSYIYLNNNDYEKALPLAQKAYDYGKEKGSLEEKIAFSSNLAEILDGLGRTKEAFPYMQSSYNMSDSLHRKQSTEAIAEMLTKFETQKKEQQIVLLGKENDIQKLDLRNQELELNQQGLELENKDYSINLKNKEIQGQKLNEIQQKQQIKLLATEKENINLKLKQRNSFLISILLISMILSFLGFQYFKKRQLQAKNQIQEEKLRISQELHDNIGSQLTFISNSIESFEAENGAALKLEEAKKITKNTIRELRRTVWLINQPEFNLDEFVIKLRDYVKPMETGKPLIQINSNTQDIVLQPIVATNLFRIIQEIINNAIKYADASLIEINFKGDHNQLNINLKDDGNGFETAKLSEGYGLKNIKSRVDILKGNFNLNSSINNGTQYLISIPLS